MNKQAKKYDKKIQLERYAGLTPGLAVILDMDGVIVDSNPIHRNAWRLYNRRFGIETDEAMQQRMYGKRNDEIVRDFLGPHLTSEEVQAHGAAKERLYRELMAGAIDRALVPGLREFLQRYEGAPFGLATNAEPENVDFVLDAMGLRRYFQVIVDGTQVRMPKPDPEIYLQAAGKLGIPVRDCIVFEDSLPGLEAARTAGMRTVGVTTTHAALPDADLAIDDFRNAELDLWLLRQKPCC
jgi:beta-phosphoglucomutase family hydrolase